MIIKCLICGKDKHVYPSYVKRGRGKFCSQECVSIWRSKNMSGKNSPLWKGGPEKVKCSYCNKIFSSRNKGAKFCSHSCAFKNYYNDKKGEKNPLWKGGVIYRVKRYNIKNPEKVKAWLALGRALRRGDIIKGKCEVCGCSFVNGHHDDYTKPLEVKWLCYKHHKQYHMKRISLNKIKRSYILGIVQ